MSLIETDALVLKSYGLSEADKIVVFLTKEFGLVKGVAKGAKRLKSKFGGSLEPFSIVRLQYFQKEERELVSIRQIDLLTSYFEKASEPLFLQKFTYLSDLLFEFAPPNDPNEKMFRMAKACLEVADNSANTLDSLILYFEVWLLKLNGYLPNWSNCEICKKEIIAESANLQINFHLICKMCQKAKSNISITNDHRNLFLSVQKNSPEKFVEIAKPFPIEIKQISATLRRIISNILGKDVVSERVLLAHS